MKFGGLLELQLTINNEININIIENIVFKIIFIIEVKEPVITTVL